MCLNEPGRADLLGLQETKKIKKTRKTANIEVARKSLSSDDTCSFGESYRTSGEKHHKRPLAVRHSI
ncbi:hypothetical protein CALVIDRAFT_369724 [Calocera viscosa TUFC12733]|uniref:Uncharacterized protein n=1 Tax=Calocera viscosa (strain TUFC12733) TaxID=1330018 RepID=A0A167GX42_CALVF|nr:hypothetical protein CALVIDRAFT_369724 [Calocera viscosa TUFC12733]